MCGIVGGVTLRNIGPILLQGLTRLEYRGYDSAGIAILTENNELAILRVKGKVKVLFDDYTQHPIKGKCGLAHTRWATHGIPSKKNAHPHISRNKVAIVHNGIIENHEELRKYLLKQGYQFTSDTDSEVIAHLIHSYLTPATSLVQAVQLAVKSLQGMFAIGVMSTDAPNSLVVARLGSPLVIGLGDDENFIASDSLALLSLTNEFIYLEDHDTAEISSKDITIYNSQGDAVKRKHFYSSMQLSTIEKSGYRHYMEKEIFEQPYSTAATLEGRIIGQKIVAEIFGTEGPHLFKRVENVVMVACGTSYHAALVGRYWLEEIAGISCQVEIASEYRYRQSVIKPNTLLVVLSQSGETADTLASFRQAKKQHYLSTLAICNVPESALVRESELVFLTQAGPEIGVASTKSFTSQLIALFLLTISLGKYKSLSRKDEIHYLKKIANIPEKIQEVLTHKKTFERLAKRFLYKEHALFLGRGSLLPIAMEGALKLKEISYIHAEAYPAGELKHGPLAIVDKNMPVVVIAPDNDLFEKLKSNLEEVRARGGDLLVFADQSILLHSDSSMLVVAMPVIDWFLAPILYSIPLQLLAYYVAVQRGTDVDQPRNLAKSVTVE